MTRARRPTGHAVTLVRVFAVTLVPALAVAACAVGSHRAAQRSPSSTPPAGHPALPPASSSPGPSVPGTADISSWVYQLQGYDLSALARAPHQLAVIDLARDARNDYFTAADLDALHRAGKKVLSYFEIGSIENFRPEYPALPRDLVGNRWADWPEEFFVRYWDPRWWDQVVRPRVDQALRAGFDGAYLDTPLAYEELDLSHAKGQSRDSLARAMADLIVKISRYAKQQRPGFWIVPQNSPELRTQPGYNEAIDGIGMEELLYRATDAACTESFCRENLAHAQALRKAGKLVLAVDYAAVPEHVRAACAWYRQEGFAGYVTTRDLDKISPRC